MRPASEHIPQLTATFLFLNKGAKSMREAGEQLYTPKDLAERGIMSHVKQWSERKAGRLGFLRIGRKILYRQSHVDSYFALCESKPVNEEMRDAALS
jgi:hypothetical protein